jgi:hypothetical protein
METIWFGMLLAAGLVLGLFALKIIGALFGGLTANSYPSGQVKSDKAPYEWRSLEWRLAHFDKVLAAHEKQVRKVEKNVSAVEQKRICFDKSLGLSDQLQEFQTEIRRYRGWQCVSTRFSASRLAKALGPKNASFASSDPIHEYRFGVSGDEYDLFINSNAQRGYDDSHYSIHCAICSASGDLLYHTALGYERPHPLDQLYDWVSKDRYTGSHLRAFIPGMWVKYLFEAMRNVKSDIERERALAVEESNRRVERLAEERKRAGFIGKV